MIDKVSVVIPTKNGGTLFKDVIESISSQDFIGKIQIVVIDSGSVDDTVCYARSKGATVVSIPPETFNHGETRNHGVEISSGDIVVFLTQDAVPGDRLLIKNLVSAFEDPGVAGSYARQIPRHDSDIITVRNLNNWLTGRVEPEIRMITDIAMYKSMMPIDQYMFCNFDNVCSAIRRSVWRKIPLNRNDFGEDIDWSKRVLEAGWKIAYLSDAFVVHSHNRSILYEYKRTFMCHKKLYELFKVQTIPSIKYVFLSVFNSIKTDWTYAIKHEKNKKRLIFLILKTVPLCIACVLGQFLGARDERLSLGTRHFEV